MDVFTNDAAMQMKIAVDTDVLLGTFNQGAATNQGATAGKISASFNLGTDLAPVTLTAANILQSITALSSVLDEANVPETDRWLVIGPTERQILMQSNLAQAQFMGDPSSILRNGKIGMIDRFTVYVSNLLPRAAAGQSYTQLLLFLLLVRQFRQRLSIRCNQFSLRHLLREKCLSRSVGVIPPHIPLRRTSGLSHCWTSAKHSFRTVHSAQYFRASTQPSSVLPPLISGKKISVGAPTHAASLIHLRGRNIGVSLCLVCGTLLGGESCEHSAAVVVWV